MTDRQMSKPKPVQSQSESTPGTIELVSVVVLYDTYSYLHLLVTCTFWK